MGEIFKKLLEKAEEGKRKIRTEAGTILLDNESIRKAREYLNSVREIQEIDFCSEYNEKLPEFLELSLKDPKQAKFLAEKISTECGDCEGFKKAKSKLEGVRVQKASPKALGAKIIPSFCSFRIQRYGGEVVDSYETEGFRVEIKDTEGYPDFIYSLNPKELNLGVKEIKSIKENINKVESYDIKDFSKIKEEVKEKAESYLAKDLIPIFLRYTVGLEVLDLLFQDPKIEDVYIDSPGTGPIHIYHSDYEECRTNLVSTKKLVEKLSMRFRAKSGRAFGASSPFLHTKWGKDIRVAGITEPLTNRGTGFAFRKHRKQPWTLPQFVANETMDAETAGLLSLFMSSQLSLLVTGPRGSGKTSLLSALIAEIPQHYRFIIIEDTPELPVRKLKKRGYKIEHLITESSLGQTQTEELTADQALRHALRLGESVLVIGEVRGPEAQSLFEAMRIGATGNVVMGTIHGSSPYDTFDRIVNDLRVPRTSFKACDAVVSLAFKREGGKTQRKRKVTRVTEVGKKWEKNPLKEEGFKDLIEFDYSNDKLKKADLDNSELLEKIAHFKGYGVEKVKTEWKTRTYIMKKLVERAQKNPKIIELPFVLKSNNKVFDLMGKEDSFSKIKSKWLRWLDS